MLGNSSIFSSGVQQIAAESLSCNLIDHRDALDLGFSGYHVNGLIPFHLNQVRDS